MLRQRMHNAVVLLQQERVVLEPLPACAQAGAHPDPTQELSRSLVARSNAVADRTSHPPPSEPPRELHRILLYFLT